MKTIYISIVSLLLVLSVDTLNAQVTIGLNKAPNPGALLELTESLNGISTKGLLMPRVRLNEIAQPTPQTEHVRGMIVYNLTENGNVRENNSYINNGFGWYPLGYLPEPTAAGDYLSLNDNYELIWKNIEVPQPTPGIYTLINSQANNLFQINEIDMDDSPWFIFGDTIRITPRHQENRLIVTVQVLMNKEYDPVYKDGWLSYSGGIFSPADQYNPIDSRNGTLIYEAFNQVERTYSLVTLHFVIEDLQAGENKYMIKFKRNKSVNFNGKLFIGYDNRAGDNGPNLFNTSSSIAVQYYEEKSSPII